MNIVASYKRVVDGTTYTENRVLLAGAHEIRVGDSLARNSESFYLVIPGENDTVVRTRFEELSLSNNSPIHVWRHVIG